MAEMVEYQPTVMDQNFDRWRLMPLIHRAHARRFSWRLYVRFRYSYQTADNEIIDGSLYARSRLEAYRLLAGVGIKPYKMLGRDPLPWRMKAAVVLLSIVSIQLLAAVMMCAAQ